MIIAYFVKRVTFINFDKDILIYFNTVIIKQCCIFSFRGVFVFCLLILVLFLL